MTSFHRNSLAALALVLAASLFADTTGLRPRPDASSYPAKAQFSDNTVAAASLSPEQVRNSFATDLNKGYVVFEVAFYPGPNGSLKISPDDFLLKVKGQDDAIRPAEPAVVARTLQEKNAPQQASRRSTVDVYPTASVGYESGRDTNDGTYNNGQRTHGWYSSVGVAVAGGVGGSGSGPSGPSTERDRSTMESELYDKSLPEGAISQPTAGYLYFPAPKGKQKAGAQYELQYMGEHGMVTLALTAPATPKH